MRELGLSDAQGVRFVPDDPAGVGVLVLAGSSGRIDADRARLLADQGALTESIRWFGGVGQPSGPWEVPIEMFLARVDSLARDCDRVVVVGSSFGAEAALLTGVLSDQVDAVVALAPSDVVWAGVTDDGRVTSHWTHAGSAVPFVPFAPSWEPDRDPPAYVDLYRRSRHENRGAIADATIEVERISELVLVAGGDDQVWPAVEHAERIRQRRSRHGLPTTLVVEAEAGHRCVLPGEPEVTGGVRMRRGGNPVADRRLGLAAWVEIRHLLEPPVSPTTR